MIRPFSSQRCAGEPQSIRECQAFAAASLPEGLAAKNPGQPSAREDNKAAADFHLPALLSVEGSAVVQSEG